MLPLAAAVSILTDTSRLPTWQPTLHASAEQHLVLDTNVPTPVQGTLQTCRSGQPRRARC